MLERIGDRILMIFLLLLIIGIIGGAVWFYYNGMESSENTVATSNSVDNNVVENTSTNTDDTNNTISNVDHSGEYIDLSNWCGTYVNTKNGKEFSIYQNALLSVNASIFPGEITYDSINDALSGIYPQLGGDKSSNITIKKAGAAIKVEASTLDPQSDLASYNGTYTKKEYTSVWNGIYKSEAGAYVVLSEPEKGVLNYTIQREYSVYSGKFNQYTETEAKFANEVLEEKIELNIVKSEKGISVKASSTQSESLYNKITGEYTKLP